LQKALQGFTLIEMSIVLVVIGLIVGGILTGQEMIKSATVRSEVSELEKVETAIYAFRDKYGGLPGDLSNATTFFGTTDANGYTVANGNGDGTILSSITAYNVGNCLSADGTQFFNAGSVPNEVEEVFHHLNLAGMGNYNIAPPAPYANSGLTSFPNAVLGGVMLVTCMNQISTIASIPTAFQNGTAIMIGGVDVPQNQYGSTRIQYVMGGASYGPMLTITPDMASRLDAKIDDGLPLTGRVGVPMTCSGNFNVSAPSTYTAMVSTCSVSMVKMLWQ
jgi:prepilin-type N-terminal cleavage/methylation domain-containing protein